LTCGGGAMCVGVDDTGTKFYCAQLCCTDADCGTGGTCTTMEFQDPLPSGVGVCVPM